MSAICQAPGCGRAFKAKRSTRRYCSPGCRKAAFFAGRDSEGAGTLSRHYDTVLSVPDAPASDSQAAVAAQNVIEVGRLAGDTIADRRWRIVLDGDARGMTAQRPPKPPEGAPACPHGIR